MGGWTGTARERGKALGNLAKVPLRALADRRKNLVQLSQRYASRVFRENLISAPMVTATSCGPPWRNPGDVEQDTLAHRATG